MSASAFLGVTLLPVAETGTGRLHRVSDGLIRMPAVAGAVVGALPDGMAPRPGPSEGATIATAVPR